MDSLVEDVDGWGRFQWMMAASIKFGVMSIAWSMMQMAFAGLVPDWWCLPSSHHHGNASSDGRYGNWSRDNGTFQVCEIPGSGGESCEGHIVFDDSVATVVNEWSLVCDLGYAKSMMTSLQMGGVLLGALVGGQCSDTFGRRHTVYMTSLLHLVTSLVAAFSVSWEMFVVMRILIGVSLGLYLVSSFPYPLEFVSPKYRQVLAAIPAWNSGVAIFAFMAWLTENWSYLHIGSALLGVPFLLTYFFIPESVRWLATKGRLEEAEAVLNRIARMNGRQKPDNVVPRLRKVAEEEKMAGQGRRYTYLDVYRGWRMASTTLILNAIWFSLSFCYYGISFGVSGLSGNVYLNIALMTLVPIPTNLSTIFFSNRLGRRWACFLFFTLCSLSSFAILVVNEIAPEQDRGQATTALAMVSKLSVGAAWVNILTFTSEQYPTVIRNLGYGASNTVARVGGALAPVLLNMDTTEEVVRGYIIVGALMGGCGVMALLLKETKGLGLQDSITVDKVKDTEQNKVKDGWGSQDGHSKGTEELSIWTVNGENKQDKPQTETFSIRL